MEGLCEFKIFFHFLSGFLEVKIVPHLDLILVDLSGPEIIVGESSLTHPGGCFIKPGLIDKRMVNGFKRTIAFRTLIMAGKEVGIHETASTEVNDQATGMVAGIVGVTVTAVSSLEGHLREILALKYYKL